MQIGIRSADTLMDAEALAALDARIFPPSDAFETDEWKDYDAFWIIVDGETVGCMAVGPNLEFSISQEEDIPSPGSLYLATTGILLDFQGKGIGSFVKHWQIDWAKDHGFKQISTNCRQGNAGSLHLNKKFGFRVIGEVANYYENPDEATIVMELKF